MSAPAEGPHQGQPILTSGEPLDRAQAAMILLHGRGATAESILGLAGELDAPGFTYLAPQAAGNSWYPFSFRAPVANNEPGISSGIAVIQQILGQLAEGGLPAERTVLLGFSQGACLTLEFAARHARRYGGVVGLSGGLIGPDGMPRTDAGSLGGTPVFVGCGEADTHIPQARVQHAAEVLRGLGGEVTVRLYPDMGHNVNRDELDFVRGLMAALVA